MKKILSTTGDIIRFRPDGSTLLEISTEGVLATDAQAAEVEERLGSQVNVVDASDEDIEKAEAQVAAPAPAAAAPAEAPAPATEAAPAAETAPAGDSQQQQPAPEAQTQVSE